MLWSKIRGLQVRHLNLLSACGLLLTVGFPEVSRCSEGPQPPIHAVSPHGAWELDITAYHLLPYPKRRFTLRREGRVARHGEVSTLGRLAYVNDQGTYFVLHDCYAGLALYQASGRLVRQWAPEELLGAYELWYRPDRWSCHPEGVWAAEGSPVSFSPDGRQVTAWAHSDRKIVIDLESGQILTSGDIVPTWVLFAAGSFLALGLAIHFVRRRRADFKRRSAG